MFIHYRVIKCRPMRNLYFRVPRNTAEYIQFRQNGNSRCSTPEEFLPIFVLVSS